MRCGLESQAPVRGGQVAAHAAGLLRSLPDYCPAVGMPMMHSDINETRGLKQGSRFLLVIILGKSRIELIEDY